MPNYSNSIIYKLCCKDINIKEIYVGSTTNFRSRKAENKKDCKDKDRKVFVFIRENGGWENWDMVMIEEYPCDNIRQLLKRERYWIEELSAILNIEIPSRTNKEYYDENKKNISDKRKEKYRENIEIEREKAKIRTRKYREDNKEKLEIKHNSIEFKQMKKEYNKEYRENNKELLMKNSNQYYYDNKETINKKKRENIITCENCNKKINKNSLTRHLQTQYCMTYK